MQMVRQTLGQASNSGAINKKPKTILIINKGNKNDN